MLEVKEIVSINSYRDLKVWKKAIVIVEEIYAVTQSFPKEEIYCLTSKIRRCAISVPSNIAGRLKFINDTVRSDLEIKIAELGRTLNGLRLSLTKKLNSEL